MDTLSDILLVIGILILLYSVVTVTAIIIFSAKTPKKQPHTLVVLGCKIKDSKPTKSLKRRLDCACSYLINNKNVYCIVSGGKGNDENISEAECMYRYLTDKGIDQSRIIKEEHSTNTKENILNSARLIQNNNLPSNIVIATDFYHHLRGNIVAKKHKISVIGAVSCVPTVKMIIINIIRELIAIPVEILKPKDRSINIKIY